MEICWSNFKHPSFQHNTYQLYIYIYSIPPDDGLQICPKHVEVDWRNKLRINSVSSWFLLHRFIEMHCQQNIKKKKFTTLERRSELTACVLYQVRSTLLKTKTILISAGKCNRSHSWTVCFLKQLRFISVVKIPAVWHEGGATQLLFFTHLWLWSPNDHEQTQDELHKDTGCYTPS